MTVFSLGRVVALGGDAEVAALAGPDTAVVDLAGRTAIPGIVDSHCHPDSYALKLVKWTDLSPRRIASRAGLLDAIRARSRSIAPDAWFVGYRFDERKSGGYPSRAELDTAAEGRPAFILRTDGHIGLANSRALVGPADQGALSISCGPPAHDGSAWDYDAEYELGCDADAALAPHEAKDA